MSAENSARRPQNAEPRPRIPTEASSLPRRADRRATASRGARGRTPAVAPRPRDLFFVVIVVLALLKAELSRVLALGSANPLATIALESAAIVLFLGAVDLLWRRRSYTIDLVGYSVLSLVMLANVMYASFFGQLVSPELLSVVGQAADVGDSIASLLRPVYLLYLVDIPLLVAWAFLLQSRPNHTRPSGRSRPVAIATGVAAVVLAVQVGLVLGLSADADSASVANVRGLGVYQAGSIARLAMPDPTAAAVSAIAHGEDGADPGRALQKRIEAIRQGGSGARIGGVKTGQYAGKNVIVVQVEALQDLIVGKRYDGKEITPALNDLVGQSWYFPNGYSQTSAGNTVDAEFTVNTSLLAPINGAASLEYADRELPGLPRLLRAQGYDAITFHQNDVRFWNRIELYPALGFRRWWDRSYFKNRDKIWHASDRAMLSMGMRILKSEEASSAPFYAHIITESSHYPFKGIPLDRRPLLLSAGDMRTFSGGYVSSMSYTDKAMGEFFSALKKSGIWDDSIVVVYGDHSALLDTGANKGDSRVADDILGRPYTFVDHQRIPVIIHLPGQTKAHTLTKPLGQVDIMPTIADLVGLDLSGTPHVGRSAFIDSPAFVMTRAYMPSGSFINDRVAFMPGLSFDDGSAVSIRTAEKVTPTDAERQGFERAKQLTLLSDAWVKSLPKRADSNGTAGAIIPH